MDAGVVSGLLQLATQGRLSRREDSSLGKRRVQKASHRKRLRRRRAVCGVAAPPRCAPASPSSRLLASDPAALATPPTPFFSSLGRAPNASGEPQRDAGMLKGMDFRKVREDPSAENLAAFLDDADARGRVARLDTLRRDLVGRHREGGQENIRTDLYLRIRDARGAAERHIHGAFLAAARVLPGQAYRGISLRDLGWHDQTRGNLRRSGGSGPGFRSGAGPRRLNLMGHSHLDSRLRPPSLLTRSARESRQETKPCHPERSEGSAPAAPTGHGSRFFGPLAAPSPPRLWRVGDLRMTNRVYGSHQVILRVRRASAGAGATAPGRRKSRRRRASSIADSLTRTLSPSR